MNTVSVTPLLGGSEDGAVCSLLEFGGKRILLDCGSNYIIDSNYQSLLLKIANDLKNSGGVDALIISHADMHHIGSMPFLLGREGMSGVPIICTLPVYKFGQILLYDHCANGTMEDVNNIHNYEYEDIDEAFANVHTVKYSQVLDLNVICNSNINSNSIDATEPEISVINSAKRAPVTICAYPSGRTVGGAIWRISYGPAEILYAMDMNLKKEIVLDSVKMDLLPSGPALMIVEGPHPYQGVAKGTKKRKDKDESAAMLNSIMETLRSNGNVLIPCETSGRTLELLQILGKYWYENKLGLYQLFFLSHMSKNLPEFAQMQLEWMSDALSKQFYNGKPNPFELPQVKFITSSREIEKFPGPKVVLATDSSLSYGLAKEVLLMWGGDPRCRVIFTDIGSNGGNSSGDTSSGQIPSLALEIIEKYSTPPIICTITRPLKVELVGEELLEYQKEMEKVRKEQEEELQKKRRRDELSQLNIGARFNQEEGDTDDEEDEHKSKDANKTDYVPQSKRPRTTNFLSKFLLDGHSMFESRELQQDIDDYGATIDDLTFRDINPIDSVKVNRESTLAQMTSGPEQNEYQSNIDSKLFEDIPTKIVPTKVRLQFTCDIKVFNLGARADLKGIKTITAKVSPQRLLVLRSTPENCAAVVSFAKTMKIDAYAPQNRSPVKFSIQSAKLNIHISQASLPSTIRAVQAPAVSSAAAAIGSSDNKCYVCTLRGKCVEVNSTLKQEGTRLVKYIPEVLEEVSNEVNPENEEITATNNAYEIEDGDETADATTDINYASGQIDDKLAILDNSIGVVSLGEVTLNNLRQRIEKSKVHVEYRLGSDGGMLLCDGQVLLRKNIHNDFVIEGPPIPAYYEVRKALYQHFAFI